MDFFLVNGLALMHIYYAAYETKGYTLEEMHEAFDSRLPPWKFRQGESRVEALASRIRQQQRQQQRASIRSSRGTGAIAVQEEEEGWPFRRRSSVQA